MGYSYETPNFELEPSELRAIILGKRVYKKCPNCDKNGFHRLKMDDDFDVIGPVSDYEYEKLDEANRWEGDCDNCDALGYVIAIMEEDEE